MRAQPGRDLAFRRKLPAVADKLEQLPASTIFVAVGFGAKGRSHKEGNKKAQQSQPGKKNIKKAQCQI